MPPIQFSLFHRSFATLSTPTHTPIHTACVHTYGQTHSELSIPVTNKHKHIKSAALSTRKLDRTNTRTRWMSMAETKHGPMKNACPFACFIRNAHRDSIPIPAEIPHKNINYTGNLWGRSELELCSSGIRYPQYHLNERVTISCSLRNDIARLRHAHGL